MMWLGRERVLWSKLPYRRLGGLTVVALASFLGAACVGQLAIQLEPLLNPPGAPRLINGGGTVALLKGQPIELRFSQPLQGAFVEMPPLPVEATVDPEDLRVLRVHVQDAEPGQDYSLRVADIVGLNGAKAETHTLVLRTPEPARLLTVNGLPAYEGVVVAPNAAVWLEWDRPVTSISYSDGERARTWSGRATTRVQLPTAVAPGQTLELTVEDATTVNGGWLPGAQLVPIFAPSVLQVAGTWPDDGTQGFDPGQAPILRFSAPVANQGAVEAAISFDTETPGWFDWLGPDRVRFVPADQFPSETLVTMRVAMESPGTWWTTPGFALEPMQMSFHTSRLKVIDVSLSQQRLTLYEDDQAVWSARVATGVRGAETPPGTYHVQYKMPTARFRGVNPSGLRYDIPNVHWVMPFSGDYTIHGAHWRSVFGSPMSNGCVSMSDPDAKRVYDWAEEGTRVVIRA